jgi:hypothetical protein
MEWRKHVPSVEPASLCESLSAGNLKKINKNREPSKKQDVSASTSIFESGKRSVCSLWRWALDAYLGECIAWSTKLDDLAPLLLAVAKWHLQMSRDD